MTPTPGWRNFDNSLSIRLAGNPLIARAARFAGLLNDAQNSYVTFCQERGIEFADATDRIPLDTASTNVVYSSHMLEHLERPEAIAFLAEVHRVLAPRGVLRIAVPDLARHARKYITDGNADAFIANALVCAPKPKTLKARLNQFIVGGRHHHWMYDGRSLCKLLEEAGFARPLEVRAGETRISDPGPLDLFERSEESVYVEAEKA